VIIFDSSAVLAILNGEPGAHQLELLLDTQPCALPRTCASDVVARLMRDGMNVATARGYVNELELIELPFDVETCDATAQLEHRTRSTGTSFVDRSCIATGIVHDSLVVSTDRDWAKLDIPEADIRLVR
jgi:PIN domain nuclease of toxin-antitoxin system